MKEHRNRFSPRVAVKVHWTEEMRKASKVKQQFAEEMNINNIMRKYNRTGILPDLIKQNPVYADFSNVPDYQESLNRVILAQEQFMALPADVRKRFGNDPEQFLNFAQDPSHVEEMIEMGLATRKEKKAPESGAHVAKTGEKPPSPKGEKKNPPVPKEPEDK